MTARFLRLAGLGCALLALSLVIPGHPRRSASAVTALPAPWPERTISTLAGGFVGAAIVPGSSSAIGAVGGTGLDAFSRLDRVDLRSGANSRGSLVFTGGYLVALGDELGYVEPRTEAVEPDGEVAPRGFPGAEEIRMLRTGTASVRSATYLPLTEADALARSSPSPRGAWAGETGRVVFVSLPSGHILRSISLPDPAAPFSVAVLGSTLYAIAAAVDSRPIEVYEVSLATGEVVASRAIEGVAGYLSAVPSGVWVAYRTGMLGTAQLLARSNLAVLAGATPTSRSSEAPLPGSSQGMGIELAVTPARRRG